MSNYKDGDIYINADEFLEILSVAVHEDGYVHLHIGTIEGALDSVKSLQIADDSKAIPHKERIKQWLKKDEFEEICEKLDELGFDQRRR